MNTCFLSGRLVKEPTFRVTETEKGIFHIANFTLAVGRMKSEGTSFIRVNVFSGLADNVNENLHKGMKVTVSGEIVTGSYTEKDSGRKIYTTEVNANWLEFDLPRQGGPNPMPEDEEPFMDIPPEQLEELPFK